MKVKPYQRYIIVNATVPRRFECREMSIEQAIYIADRLMKHLFNA